MPLFDNVNENPNPKDEASSAPSQGQADQTSAADEQAYPKVAAILDKIRPYLQADGGDVELIKVEDLVVYVRLVGACHGCPSSLYTLKNGIEARVVELVPEIKSVEMI